MASVWLRRVAVRPARIANVLARRSAPMPSLERSQHWIRFFLRTEEGKRHLYQGAGRERPTHIKEGADDIWSGAIKPWPDPEGQAVLLVEDSSMRRQMAAASTVNGVPTVRLILLDRSLYDLEAPFTGGRNAAVVSNGVKGGIGIDDVMSSGALRDCYHRHKSFGTGSVALEVSDPNYRVFVRVSDASTKDRGLVRVPRMTQLKNRTVLGLGGPGWIPSDTVPEEEDSLFGRDDGNQLFAGDDVRDVKYVLCGLPISRNLTYHSPAGHVKDVLCWLWPRSQISRCDVEVRWASSKTPVQESELEGELLFHAPPSGPTVKFAFSDSEFVAGDLEIMINGVPVRVFVNTQDTRNWGRASEERGSRVFAPSPIHNTAISRIFDTAILCLAPLNPRSLSLSLELVAQILKKFLRI